MIQANRLPVVIFLLFSLSPAFAQSFSGQVEDFAATMSEALPFAASVGLNWSTPYIGQFVGNPLHFGVGVTAGSVFMNNGEVAELAETFGVTIDGAAGGKQWLPVYAASARMGGLGGLPFDIGLKAGGLPEIPLWGTHNYRMMLIGADVRFRLYLSGYGGAVISIGGGYDRFEGSVSATMGTLSPEIKNELQNLAKGKTITAEETPMHLTWESNVIKAKILFLQPIAFLNSSFFGGAELGIGFNKAGIGFGDNRSSPAYEYTVDVSGIAFSTYMGLGYNPNAWHFDLALMMNLVNFEFGLNFSVRYQL
jgi:hypothetical protein